MYLRLTVATINDSYYGIRAEVVGLSQKVVAVVGGIL